MSLSASALPKIIKEKIRQEEREVEIKKEPVNIGASLWDENSFLQNERDKERGEGRERERESNGKDNDRTRERGLD